MITIKVTFEDGDYFTTGFNDDFEGARKYYFGKFFSFYHPIKDEIFKKAIKVEQI